MSKFKVGDIVKGIYSGAYGVTNTDMTRGEVVDLKEGGIMEVVIKEHKKREHIGKSFYVMEDHFELVEEKSEESDALRRLNKIAKKFKKLALKNEMIDCSCVDEKDCPLKELVINNGIVKVDICNMLHSAFQNIPLVGDEDE